MGTQCPRQVVAAGGEWEAQQMVSSVWSWGGRAGAVGGISRLQDFQGSGEDPVGRMLGGEVHAQFFPPACLPGSTCHFIPSFIHAHLRQAPP